MAGWPDNKQEPQSMEDAKQENTAKKDNNDLKEELSKPAQETAVNKKEALEQKTTKPQAVLDMEAASMSPDNIESLETKPKTNKSSRENVASIARFRWILLLTLSVFGTITWTADAFSSQWPFKWLAIALSAVSILVGAFSFKFISLPTRASFTALIWSFSFLLTASYGPPSLIFNKLPTSICWAAMLILIALWLGLSIWRRLGRFKILDIIISAILLYAASSPIFSLVNYISGSGLGSSFQKLSESPSFISSILPWFLTPMGVITFFVLPLAVFFALWDQISVLKRSSNRHPANFIFALCFILLWPYCFLSFPAAKQNIPVITQFLRSVHHPGGEWLEQHKTFFASDNSTASAVSDAKHNNNIEVKKAAEKASEKAIEAKPVADAKEEDIRNEAEQPAHANDRSTADLSSSPKSRAEEDSNDTTEATPSKQEKVLTEDKTPAQEAGLPPATYEFGDSSRESRNEAIEAGISLKAYRLQQEQIERLEAKVSVMNDRMFELESRIRQLEGVLTLLQTHYGQAPSYQPYYQPYHQAPAVHQQVPGNSGGLPAGQAQQMPPNGYTAMPSQQQTPPHLQFGVSPIPHNNGETALMPDPSFK